MIEAKVNPRDHHVFCCQVDECHLDVVKKNLNAAAMFTVIRGLTSSKIIGIAFSNAF